LIYLPNFDDVPLGSPCLRPAGRGTYLPLTWDEDRCPIKAIMPHSLAALDGVERRVLALPQWKSRPILQSALRPRPSG
jgi:hypothetical protein